MQRVGCERETGKGMSWYFRLQPAPTALWELYGRMTMSIYSNEKVQKKVGSCNVYWKLNALRNFEKVQSIR